MPSTVDSSSDIGKRVFRKKEDIVSRKIAGETLLVPIRGKLADMQRIFSLNPVAEFIWDQLDGERNVKGLHDGVLHAFDVGEEQAEVDISQLIDELLKADLIVEVE